MIFVISIVIFLLSAIALLNSYAIYPAWLKWAANGKKDEPIAYQNSEEGPTIHIVMAAYNEEKVIEQKILSIWNQEYPKAKWKLHVGSDNSNDRTNEILQQFQQLTDSFDFRFFDVRQGKAAILNRFVKEIQQQDPDSILILTDANVMFKSDLLFQLSRRFLKPEIGQVSAQIINTKVADGISPLEAFYIQRENQIKYREGLLWGAVQGAFGACYALRTSLYPEIPPAFLMEDFYISMSVLKAGHLSVVEPLAIAYEDVPSELMEEYSRKLRISAGNYQNLKVFYPILFRFNAVSFAFFSHKVLRWLGPFFLLAAFFSSLILCFWNQWFYFLFCTQLILLLSPLWYRFTEEMGVNAKPLRWLAYFYSMNLALLMGFFRFLGGIQNSAWKPTKRTT